MSADAPGMKSNLLAEVFTIIPPVTGPRLPRYLESLWVTHARCLAQAIHQTIGGRPFVDLPEPIVRQMRIGVKVLLSNMVRARAGTPCSVLTEFRSFWAPSRFPSLRTRTTRRNISFLGSRHSCFAWRSILWISVGLKAMKI